MSVLYTARIEGKFFLSADKKEFEARLAKAADAGDEVEDRSVKALSDIELDELKLLLSSAKAKKLQATPSGLSAIKEAIQEIEEDGF